MKTSSVRAASALAAAVLLLAACSGSAQHQVVGASEECVSCHEEKPVFARDAGAPSGAVESGSRLNVRADADAVSVCVPRFTAEDGSRYVPVEASRATLEGGSATLELEEGLWAICVDEGDKARAQLVHVDPSRSEAAAIDL